MPDVEEALRRTNATSYGLAGSVFAATSEKGVEIARRVRSGMTSVNSVIAFASVPALPFGGIGESGFGRIHGEDGLREFARAKAITRQRFALPVALTSFSRPEKVTGQLVKAVKLLHGRGLKPQVRSRRQIALSDCAGPGLAALAEHAVVQVGQRLAADVTRLCPAGAYRGAGAGR